MGLVPLTCRAGRALWYDYLPRCRVLARTMTLQEPRDPCTASHSRRMAAGPHGRRRYNLMLTLGRRRGHSTVASAPPGPHGPHGPGGTADIRAVDIHRATAGDLPVFGPLCTLGRLQLFTTEYLHCCLRIGAGQLSADRHLPCVALAPLPCQHIYGGQGIDRSSHCLHVSEGSTDGEVRVV